MSTTTQLHSKPAGQLRRRWRRTPCLSSQQLDRAVFLDFESFRDGPPLFCGMLIDGQFKQVVFEVGLAKAAAEKGLAVCERRPHLLQIVEQAEREDRLIVGFSTKECTDLYEVTGQQLGERYLNALSLSKKWRKKFHPSAHKAVLRRRERLRRRGKYVNGLGNRLTDFASLIACKPPRDYGRLCEAQRIRHVIGQLERRGTYDALTRVAKAKWTKALKHNEFDVRALTELCRQIVTDFG